MFTAATRQASMVMNRVMFFMNCVFLLFVLSCVCLMMQRCSAVLHFRNFGGGLTSSLNTVNKLFYNC